MDFIIHCCVSSTRRSMKVLFHLLHDELSCLPQLRNN
ncbi:hypothetical protein Godav_020204 [Gossypium davidsonii]|uniref:Uncharacterized protein n=3 Tax=Gossypium TaxID=3633 RepID=A0A7J9IPQ5_9ROSI|nr:hypothetical protein [Gossypium raimondii]MBA0607943.1 hypothetical protein [Gossypium davidsonii]MBA0824091.1 hypothetical protein [Gossypium armourianum]